MTKSLVQRRVARYPIWAVYIGMLIIAASGNSRAEEALDVTTTIVKAVEHRLSMVETLQGRVLLRYVHSDRYNAATSRSRAASAADRGQDAGTMPPLERNHLSLSDFEYDIEMQRWRREVVDLINSGHDWHRTGYATLLNSDLEPSYYYNYSLCDGEKVYTYKRSTNQGSVDYYQNLNQLPSDLWQIPARIVTMISIDVLRALQHHGHVAIQLSNENIEGIHCLRLRIDPPSQETGPYNSKIMARLWIAPALGYAVVREERLVLDLSNTPLRFSVSTNSNFVELMPGLWCPKYARTDRFFYTSFFWGELDEQRSYAGPSAWGTTRVIQWGPPQDGAFWPAEERALLDVKVNAPIDVSTPFFFPFDAKVVGTPDRAGGPVRHSPSLSLKSLIQDLLPDIEPDPLGLEPPEELARRFMEGRP